MREGMAENKLEGHTAFKKFLEKKVRKLPLHILRGLYYSS